MLKPETERVWTFLSQQPVLAGFVLTGGSALALQLHHRLSEDLDLLWPGQRLPRLKLEAWQRLAAEQGFLLAASDDPAAVVEFNDAGLDLLDYHQDYLVDGKVRVSFFAPEAPFVEVMEKLPAVAGPRLATVAEIARSKALLTARRSRTRDWFDLFVLMQRTGFTLADFHDAFARAGIAGQAAVGLERLCAGKPSAGDEGFEQLALDAPTLPQMRQFFCALRGEYERAEATKVRRQESGGSNTL